MSRKHILLRNEIKMMQIILREEGFPTKEYRLELANRLEELKELWYKTKSTRRIKGCGKFISRLDNIICGQGGKLCCKCGNKSTRGKID